jgi:DNA-binding PadR family transcriptional regulator
MLTKYEEILLVAVYKLQGNAYGAALKRYIRDVTGKDWNYGNLYCTLDQLVKKKYISKTIGEPTPERGGRSKNYYNLTSEGLEVLSESMRIYNALWEGISEPALNKGI